MSVQIEWLCPKCDKPVVNTLRDVDAISLGAANGYSGTSERKVKRWCVWCGCEVALTVTVSAVVEERTSKE